VERRVLEESRRIRGLADQEASGRAEERLRLNSMWRKREKQLQRALDNLTAFHGQIRGIGGAQIAEIEYLALTPPETRPALASGPVDSTPDVGAAAVGARTDHEPK
jgi:hypothetical protein